MRSTEIAFFAVTLFFALASLIRWKRRRDRIAATVNRGLRGYVAARSAIWLPGPEQTPARKPIPI